MKNTLRFPVTQEHIDKSICGNRAQCMIAVAAKEKYGTDANDYVRVDENGLSMTRDGLRWRYKLSAPVKRKAKSFDNDKTQATPFIVYASLENVQPVTPKTTRERKDQINQARRDAAAALKSAGGTPKRYNRFV